MIAVLFARPDSIYKQIPDCDVWDKDRNALNWPGSMPVVAHPPCRAWGQLQHFAKPELGERELAIWAVEQIRRWGGVLEHPFGSRLWAECGLPVRNQSDIYGGWTLGVLQYWWGHRAAKATRLYIVGCSPSHLPSLPFVLGDAPCVVQTRKRIDHRPHLRKPEREHTPEKFAHWMVEVARRCDPRSAERRLA